MNDQEKFFFTDESGNPTTYTTSNGSEAPRFSTDAKRLKCIELFLAYHAENTGKSALTDKDKHGSFIYLFFNGDNEVYDASIHPEDHKNKIVWKKRNDFDKESKQYEMSEGLDQIKNPFTAVLAHVNKLDSNDVLFMAPYNVMLYELFTEVRLPWIIQNKDNKPGVAFLSCFQKELFFDNGDKNIKVDFYMTPDGYEPAILDEQKRSAIISQVASRIIENDKSVSDIPENQVLVLKFKNGDRDVLSAWAGTIRYKCYDLQSIDDFSNELYYDKLKSTKNPILILNYIPGSDKLMYFGVTCKL